MAALNKNSLNLAVEKHTCSVSAAYILAAWFPGGFTGIWVSDSCYACFGVQLFMVVVGMTMEQSL